MTQIEIHVSVSNPADELCTSVVYSSPSCGSVHYGMPGKVIVTKYAFGRKMSSKVVICSNDSPVLTLAQESGHTIESVTVNGRRLGDSEIGFPRLSHYLPS